MLESFLEEFCQWKFEQGDPLEFAPGERGGHWLVVDGGLQRLSVSLAPMDDPHDDQAVVVETALGEWSDFDLRSLLQLSAARMYVSRFSIVPRGQREVLVVEAGVPCSAVSLPMFDRMIREVLSIASYLLAPVEVPSL